MIYRMNMLQLKSHKGVCVCGKWQDSKVYITMQRAKKSQDNTEKDQCWRILTVKYTIYFKGIEMEVVWTTKHVTEPSAQW